MVWVKSCMGLGGVCHAPKKLGQHYGHQHNGHPAQVGTNHCQGGGLPLFHACILCLGIDKAGKQHGPNTYPRYVHWPHRSPCRGLHLPVGAKAAPVVVCAAGFALTYRRKQVAVGLLSLLRPGRDW